MTEILIDLTMIKLDNHLLLQFKNILFIIEESSETEGAPGELLYKLTLNDGGETALLEKNNRIKLPKFDKLLYKIIEKQNIQHIYTDKVEFNLALEMIKVKKELDEKDTKLLDSELALAGPVKPGEQVIEFEQGFDNFNTEELTEEQKQKLVLGNKIIN